MNDLVLNWGIISVGKISQDFCTALLTLNSSFHKLQACAARTATNSEAFAKKFSVTTAHASYADLIADKAVNIIYIGSINVVHKDLSIEALNAGKHVLCEKPMCMNSKEQEEVLSLAKEKGLFFMEALWTRHFPFMDRLRQEIFEKKSIGNLKFFSSNFMVPIKDVERLRQKELGGGTIYDIGIYPIQLACLVFEHEMPVKITCSGHLMETGVEETVSICLLYSGGRMAVVNVSASTAIFAPTHIVGDKGVLQIPEYSWAPTEMILPDGGVVREALPECGPTNFARSVGLRFQAEAAREAIAAGLIEHAKVTHDNSRVICRIMDECRKQMGNTIPSDF